MWYKPHHAGLVRLPHRVGGEHGLNLERIGIPSPILECGPRRIPSRVVARRMRKFLGGVLVGLLMTGGPTLAHYVNEPKDRAKRHERVVRRICNHKHHWYHNHGVSVIPEACDE